MSSPVIGEGEGAELPAVLTPDDLATLLRIRKRAVLDAIQRGELPGVRRVGRRIRADRDTVPRWLADGHGQAPKTRLLQVAHLPALAGAPTTRQEAFSGAFGAQVVAKAHPPPERATWRDTRARPKRHEPAQSAGLAAHHDVASRPGRGRVLRLRRGERHERLVREKALDSPSSAPRQFSTLEEKR
jgi:excisionase family DNA binding protein